MPKETSKADPESVEENDVAPAETVSDELTSPRWSVVTFSGRVAGGLTYDEAFRKMEELSKANNFGLCILTDEAAARIGR